MADPRLSPESAKVFSEWHKANEALGAANREDAQRRSAEMASNAQRDDGQGGYRQLKDDLMAEETHRKNLERQAQLAKENATLDDKLGPIPSDNDRKVAAFLEVELAAVRKQRRGYAPPRRR